MGFRFENMFEKLFALVWIVALERFADGFGLFVEIVSLL